MRRHYWSCSTCADWLRGTPKLVVGNTDEPTRIQKFRYWLAEEGLDYLQDLVNFPLDRVRSIRRYLRNRWIDKTHALTSNLARGQWHEFETRLLHSCFDELVNFVEIELALNRLACSIDDSTTYQLPWYCKICFWKVWRSPEAGMSYLKWAAELKKPTQQALAAQETIALYKWWKDTRPNRPDPSESSGWNQYREEQKKAANSQNHDLGHKIIELRDRIECEYEEEDTAMLIRLMRLRCHLWT